MLTSYYNGFYLATDQRIGPWSVQSGGPSSEQENNANIIKSFFESEGWSLNAICGILGNMQAESTINPAYIQETNRFRLPNRASNLSDVPNNVMKNFFMEYYGSTRKAFAIGLVQWDGYSTSNGERQQKLVAYAIRNNYNWYDGVCQMYRLRGEWQQDSQYHFFSPVTIGGVRYTFANYVTSTASPTNLARAWQAGYERNSGGLGFRGTNAEWWYNYFTGGVPPVNPPGPDPSDPDEPIPVTPDAPLPDGEDFLPVWLWMLFRKKKEMKRPCRKM